MYPAYGEQSAAAQAATSCGVARRPSGTVEANRAMALKSPVLLDEGFSTGGAFGANGTPSAVLINAKGRIASPIAVGAQQVFELANSRGRANAATA